MRCRLDADGIVLLDRFSMLVDPGRPLAPAIVRLTGLRDADLAGASDEAGAVRAFADFAGAGADAFVGHNVGFDLRFLERAGFPAGVPRLDTADLAAILRPTAPSYALQRLAADESIVPAAAHRALDDALTCAALLDGLARRARALPPALLEEAQGHAALAGAPVARFFADALQAAARSAWVPPPAAAAVRPAERRGAEVPSAGAAFAPDGPLARGLAGFEARAEQRELAEAIERTFEEGGVLLAEAGTGVGKSLAYLAPALRRAAAGERTLVSTHTLPLQDQLVRKDLPSLQGALGTALPVAVLKGRSNYLCPRRWQLFRTQAATAGEARFVLKTLVWRASTVAGDRAELNLFGGEDEFWPRVSADDEACTARRCAATPGGCYLERARQAAARAGVVVVNHALLLHDARAHSALLPAAEHVVVDEAHRLEDVAADAFGFRLEDWRLRRDLERVARQPVVIAAARDHRAEIAETLRDEVGEAHHRAAETFALLAAVARESGLAKLRVTSGLRARDDVWLPVEVAAERLADSLAAIERAGTRLGSEDGDDLAVELGNAVGELAGARAAIQRGIHEPRPEDVVWIETGSERGSCALYVSPSHVGTLVRQTIVDRHASVVFTSATLAVGGSLDFAAERLGVRDVASTLALGSPFDHARQALLVVPTDVALPNEEEFAAEFAALVEDVARALGGRTLVLFTAHSALRDAASRLAGLEEEGIAVLAQGEGGSRRSLLERFARGGAVLLGTQSFWEGVDLPGEQLLCVIVARLPFPVPDDPLVQGRSERYEDPFSELLLPQAALRLRQGFGRLIRSAADRGAVVVCDRRIIDRDYGSVFLSSLPPARLRKVPRADVGFTVAQWCASTERPR